MDTERPAPVCACLALEFMNATSPIPHVLIVEDDQDSRELLKLLLEANGYRVTTAQDGLAALAAARRDRPAAIVSDALMPKMDGFSLCRRWMRDAELRTIPFIFYSASYLHPQDEQLALALGAVRYLTKPLKAEAFLTELRAVLQQWAGQAAPAPSAQLDELATYALQESALSRKLTEKIAQLEATNRKLQQSEARFRSLTEMSSDFYWESDATHRLTLRTSARGKPSTVAAFEGSAQIGRRRWEIPHLTPGAAGWEEHRAALDAHRPFRDFVLSRLGTDGGERFISINGDPVFDAAGTFMGYRGVGTDITERKMAEAALARESDRNRIFLRNASDGVHILDADGKVLEVSDSFCEMLGYSREELLGANVSLWDARWSALRLKQVIAEQIANQDRSTLETRHRRRDGSLFDVEVTGRGLELDGRPVLFNSARDITERKAAQANIHRLSQLYAALSQCNEAIVRCASEEELFPRICRDAVQFGGMKMAWIGLIDPDTRLVRFRARFGDDADAYLQGVEISVDADSPLGHGPTGVAIRENRPVWHQNFQDDPPTAPWHERRTRFGWGASASIPLHRGGAPVGVLTLYAAEAGAFDEAARRLLIEMATDISFALDNFAREAARARAEEQIRRHVVQIENAFLSTVRMATALGEMRDPYTAGHQRRVAEIAVAIGAALGFDARRQEGLRIAGYLHDIGKIKIPSEILSKPGRLSPAELQLVKGHAQASYDVLKHLECPWPVAEVALQHHERMDGSGYPQGLKGEAIRIEARIVAVADVVEAMSLHRPYRPGLGIETALAEIERGRGSAYDAGVVDACLRLFREKNFILPA